MDGKNNMENPGYLGELLHKHLRNELSEEEKEILDTYLGESPANRDWLKQLESPVYQKGRLKEFYETASPEARERVRKLAEARINAGRLKGGSPLRRSLVHSLSPLARYAAAVIFLLLVTGIAGYLWYNRDAGESLLAERDKVRLNEVPPGRDGAILRLADGSTLVLDSTTSGTILRQGNTRVIQQSDGQLIYKPGESISPGEVMYNTMITPRARQFRLLLPDGSRVWLNAASSIRYPTYFSGKERVVEVTGEAYFDVAQDKNSAFIVHFRSSENSSRTGTVQALGTGFNVNAYQENVSAEVTLLEGSVAVTPPDEPGIRKVLTPGEQASIQYGKSRNSIKIGQVDTERVMAWKNGILNMHNMPLSEVMKELSRWYDIDIECEGAVPVITFWGEMSRTESLSTVLDFMAKSGVRFKMENGGKKLLLQK